MMEDILLYFAGLILIGGTLFSALAAVGILRLPDFYTRMHAASKAGTLGAGLMFLAIAILSLDGPVILRAIVGFLFLLLTAPVSAHLLARAAYIAGTRMSDSTTVDDLDGNYRK